MVALLWRNPTLYGLLGLILVAAGPTLYAVWSGIGTTLIAIIGIFYFKEPSTVIKILSIGLIITGVIGLNLSGGGH